MIKTKASQGINPSISQCILPSLGSKIHLPAAVRCSPAHSIAMVVASWVVTKVVTHVTAGLLLQCHHRQQAACQNWT